MIEKSRAELGMELVEFLGTTVPADEISELFELASADPQIFFAELNSRHQAGELVLPSHLLRAVRRDANRRASEDA